MPTARQLVSSRCPECSAPVDLEQIPHAVAQVRCAYCGTPLILPKRISQPESPPVYRPPVTPPRAFRSMPVTTSTSASKGRIGLGILLALLVFIFMVGADVGAFQALQSAWAEDGRASVQDAGDSRAPGVFSAEFWQPLGLGWPATPSVGHLYGPPFPALPPAPEDNQADASQAAPTSAVQDVLIQGRNQDDQGVLFNFDPQNESLRWRAEPFSRNFLEMVVAVGPRYVYVADQNRLTALQRETGEQVWQVALANSIALPCEDCLQYMAGYVVALTRAGTLQAFDGRSGLPAWSRALESTPRRLFDAAGHPAVVDGDVGNRAIFYVLDRATGNERQAIRPTCEVDGRAGFAAPAAPFEVTPDGQGLYVLGSGSAACLWRFDLLSGEPEWVYPVARQAVEEEQVLPFAWGEASYLIHGGMIYTTQRAAGAGVLRAVDSHRGVARELVYASQHELTLEHASLDGQDNTLLVKATPNHAPNEPELWGIDMATGERRWLAQLELSHAFDTLLLHPTTSPDGQTGFFVGQCLWEEDVCLFDMLSAAHGVGSEQTRHPVRGSVNGVQLLGDMAWINIWGQLHAVELSTAEVKFVWP